METDMKSLVKIAVLIFAGSMATHAFAAEGDSGWKYGIGTGISWLTVKGNLGFYSPLAGGPVEADLDLTPSDINNAMKNAFGFGGFAAKDKWKILVQTKYMQLVGDVQGATPGGTPVYAASSFKVYGVFIGGVYEFARTGSAVWGALGGIRYTEHKWENTLSILGSTAANNFSHSWTDAVIGLTNSYYFNKEWSWNTQVDAAGGQSNGTFHGNTGIAWKFAKNWVTSLSADYVSNNYENGNKGSTDWYLYTANEFTTGVGIMYLF